MMRLELDAKTKILGDRYYLHHLVAQSNCSKIFLATDLIINGRKCAIKQLYPSYCPAKIRPKVESAFLDEAKILKQLAQKHPQICQFYNYFLDSGNQYIVQEWIEGTTLEARLRQRPKLKQSEIKNILVNILQILTYVHSLGIVHNDIKPGNIVLRLEDKLPVLIDFGVARKVNTDYGQNIVGTPGYMSVEQAMGKTIFNNDLYSLGLTAIYLLTGKSPQSINFNANKNNFWHREKSAFDPKLVATIDRAIAQTEQRFTSATEMLDMLQFSPKISVSTVTNSDRVKSKPTNLILWIAFAISGVWLWMSYFQPQLDNATPRNIVDSINDEYLSPSSTVDDLPPKKLKAIDTTNNALSDVIFVPGTSQSKVLQALGEPLWRKPGFWANSTAWSYENIVAEGFDIGYIFDSRTNTLRQAEIAVPPSTELSTVQSAMNSFLAVEDSTIDIEQGLQAVHQRQKKTHDFAVGNLKGIIQRNHKDRIYIAVWEADFH